MAPPENVTLVEVGPREGFQFEGIGKPDKISTADKIRLVEALAETGVRTIQFASFVSPRQVPQMADSEAVCAGITKRPGVDYTGIYLNDVGLKRAIATGKLTIAGRAYLTASEAFSLRNQKRNLAEDLAMQRKMAAIFRDNGYPVEHGGLMAAFGCNYEGDIPLERVLQMVASLHEVAAEVGGTLKRLSLADTMGWANPELIRRTVGAVRARWPALRINLHLHDTRGLGIANVYARWSRRLPVRRPQGGGRQCVQRRGRFSLPRTRHRDRHRPRPADRLRTSRRDDRRTRSAEQAAQGRDGAPRTVGRGCLILPISAGFRARDRPGSP